MKKEVEIEDDVAKDSEHAVVEGSSLHIDKQNLGIGESQTKEKNIVKEELEDECERKNSDEGQNWKKIKADILVKHVPYPHVPFKRKVERQFIIFTEILKNLQINIPLLRHYSKCLLMVVL